MQCNLTFVVFSIMLIKFGLRDNSALLISNLNSKAQYQFEMLRTCTPGRIGLKFDIFELIFYEIPVMHVHNSHLIDNFYDLAIKLFSKVYMFYVIFSFITFIPKQ